MLDWWWYFKSETAEVILFSHFLVVATYGKGNTRVGPL